MSTALQTTPLSAWHAAHGGRMVEFAGWNMPVQYEGIVAEHHAVRQAAGLFDISHMGRLTIAGPDALPFIDRVQTNHASVLKPGQIRYALVTNESGGILDDILVYNWPDTPRLVVNASNRTKILDWLDRHKGRFDVTVIDDTFDWAMIALQGPNSLAVLGSVVSTPVGTLKYYRGTAGEWNGVPLFVSRTGYTGEDGFEVMIPTDQAVKFWEALLEAGVPHGLQAAGLGCRDTLRLEAAMPLYGHELSEEIDPYTAGIEFAVVLDRPDFIGRDALVALSQRADLRKRVGLELAGRRIAREHSTVHTGAEQIGEVTSGTFSPTLEKSIAMAYLYTGSPDLPETVEIDIRGKREPAKVVPLPFYSRKRS